MRLWKLTFLFFLIPLSLEAQTFKGRILTQEGQPALDCYVLLLSLDSQIIQYDLPDTAGYYQVKLDGVLHNKAILRCQGLAYNSVLKTVDISEAKEIYYVDFELTEKEVFLDEVVILSEKIAIKIKNDTTIYDVSKYKKAEDNRLISVLERMPGFQVNKETGLILYKGKPIETILFDGDNLLGKAYSVGARTVPTDIIEEVEAIEDYHEDKHEKGLKKSDKVAVNLKFKKNKYTFSGEVTAALSPRSYVGNLDALSLSKKIKALATFNMNNISMNETSFKEETFSFENEDEIKTYGADLFRESTLTQSPIYQSYINNLKYLNINSLFKLNKKISFKLSGALFEDISEHRFSSGRNFTLGENNISITDETFNQGKPTYYQFKSVLNFDITKSSTLIIDNQFLVNDIKSTQSVLQNSENFYQTVIDDSKKYFNQDIKFTKKISQKDLFKIKSNYSKDTNVQTLSLPHNQSIEVNGNRYQTTKVENSRSYLGVELLYLRKVKKHTFQVSSKHTLDSEVVKVFNDLYQAYYKINTNLSLVTPEFIYTVNRKLNLKGTLNMGYMDRILHDRYSEKLDNENIFVNTKAELNYKFSNSSIIKFKFKNENELNSNYYLIATPFLIDTRTMISSSPSFAMRKSFSISGMLISSDIINQRSFSLIAEYEEVSNSMLTEYTINEDIMVTRYFQSPLTLKDFNLSTSKSFFIEAINNKITLNGNFNYSRYYNVLGGVDLFLDADSKAYTFSTNLNSAFESFFNYKASVSLTHIRNKQENNEVNINTIVNFNLKTTFLITKKSYILFENELILPDGQFNNASPLFSDASLNHRTKKLEYFIIANNLLNNKSYQQIFTDAFSTSFFSRQLFPRYIVLGLSIKF